MKCIKTGIAATLPLLLLAVTGAVALAGNVYSIQVAASTQKSSAQETSDQMNRMGHDAFVRLETIPGKGQWYRVYIERFGSKAQAANEAAMLKSLGLLKECYVRELKEEVQTEKKGVSNRIHFLHVGSYKEKGNAEKSVTRLEKKGQKAFFAEEGAGADKWFRTYIGEFADSEEARKAGSLLKEKGLISYFKVISFNKEGDRTINAKSAQRSHGS